MTRRFSLDADFSPSSGAPHNSARSNHSSGRNDPQRSNSLSRDFKPSSEKLEASVGPNSSQKLSSVAKLSKPASSIIPLSTSSRNKPIPSSQPREGPLPALPSGSSPRLSILPPAGHDSRRAAVAYPYPPRSNKSLDTSSSGSLLTSPQMPPPDLDDDRREFSAFTIIKPFPGVNILPSESENREVIPRDIPPLVRESKTVGIFKAILGLGGEEGRAEEGRAEDTRESSRTPRPDEREAVHERNANKTHSQKRVIDGGEKMISKESSASDQPAANQAAVGDLISTPSKAKETVNEEELVRELHLPEKTISNATHDGIIVPIPEVAPAEDGDGDEKIDMKEAEHLESDATNKGSDGGKKAQSENPFRTVIRKSQKDSDFDSLYDVSTSGDGSQKGVNTGNEKGDVGDERTYIKYDTSQWLTI